jgi:hypothetical protein
MTDQNLSQNCEQIIQASFMALMGGLFAAPELLVIATTAGMQETGHQEQAPSGDAGAVTGERSAAAISNRLIP